MRIYYGWVIVGISMLVLMLALGVTTNSFGLFILPVSEAFSLSRANINTGVIFLHLGMAVAAPIVGRILDLYSARRIMAVAAILFGGSFVILGLSHNVWLSAGLIAVPLSLGVVGLGSLTCMALVARWFTAYRARALAITAIGMSMGGIVVVPLVGLMLAAVGWRQSLIILGCALAVLFLLLVPFVRDRPGQSDHEVKPSDDAEADVIEDEPRISIVPLTTMQVLRMPQFWTMALSAALTFGALQAILVSLVPLAQETGLTIAQSASLLSAGATMSLLGKIVLAWLGDRVNRTVLLACLFSLVVPTSSALLFADSYPGYMACAAFLGLASGAITPAYLALVTDQFGPSSFGTANGSSLFITAIVCAISIRYGGEVYDWTGSYDVMFLTFIPTGVLSAVLMLSTRAFPHLAVEFRS